MKTIQTKNPSNKNSNQEPGNENHANKKPKQATRIAIKNPAMKTLQTKNPSNKNSNQKPSHENLTNKKPKQQE